MEKVISRGVKRLSYVFIVLTSLWWGVSCTLLRSPEVSIVTNDPSNELREHGIQKISDALTSKKISFEQVKTLEAATADIVIVAGKATGNGLAAQLLTESGRTIPDAPESLAIWPLADSEKQVWVVNGSDDTGLMYGLLTIAENISFSTGIETAIQETTEQPDAPERGVSVYTMNRAYWEQRFYDETYWNRYMDMLAENRFNSFVLIFGYENGGFLAPVYPYFFDVDGFPDVHMVGITTAQQERNLKMLNRLVEMAHQRGIRFTVGIWDHIYRGGVQGGGIAGTKDAPEGPQEHLVWGVNSENLTAYTKAGMEKFINEVPGLDGIQLRIHWESGLTEEEQLVFFPELFRMVKRVSPDLRLALRAKELPDEIIQQALEIGVNFRIDTKYWMEQLGMPYHPTKTNPDRSPIRHSYAYLLRYPQQYKIHWRLWNGGTSRILPWGSPEYVRRFVESTHLYDGEGFEVNEPLATKMEAQPHDEAPFELLNPAYRYYDYEFERYWPFYQAFGRIGYNPKIANSVLQREFKRRFGNEAGAAVQEALDKASWVLPRIITSVFPYREFPTTRGWAEKERLGDLPRYAGSAFSDMQQFASYDDEARLLIEGGDEPRIRPSENSRWLAERAAEINSLVDQARKAIGGQKNKEFEVTVTDLTILSQLASFHAKRIPAAVQYCLFQRTNDVTALEKAIQSEREAIEAWRTLVEVADDVYAEDIKMGVRNAGLSGHWRDELVALEQGLTALETERQQFHAEGKVQKAPDYRLAGAKDETVFRFSHEPVVTNAVGNPLVINVTVSAPSGIKWVRLRHRNVNQDLEYQTTLMRATGEKDTYTATVDADQIDPTWDYMYYIEVVDNDGNGCIYPDLNDTTPYFIVKLAR